METIDYIGGKPILQLIDEFLEDHQGKPGTKKNYKNNLVAFVNYCTREGIDHHKITFANLVTYTGWLKSKGKSEATVVSYIICLRQFFSYLEDMELYKNVAKKLKASVKDRLYKKKPLRPIQVTDLLNSIKTDTVIGKRDYAIINLMVRLGCRCCEVCRLDMDDIYLEEGQWVVKLWRKGSEGKNDIQGLTDKVMVPITEYFQHREHEGKAPAFINHGYAGRKDTRMDPKSVSRIVKQRLRAIGIDDPLISAHSLRHTAAVTAIQQGVDIYFVSSLLGHRDIKTTMIYLKYIEEETKKRGTAMRAIDNAY